MERETFNANIPEIISGPVCRIIEGRCKELFDSGGVDTSSYDGESWQLPLIIISAALHDAAAQVTGMLNEHGRKAAKNLRNF